MKNNDKIAVYHETLSAAFDEVERAVIRGAQLVTGYEDWRQQAGNYMERGQQVRRALEIRDPKNKRVRWVHITVYRMDSGRYELTAYRA